GEIFYTLQEESCDRKLATPLQYQAPACLAGLPASGSGGVRACLRGLAGYAIPTGSAGQTPRSAQTNHALTFKPDHPMGADQDQVSEFDQIPFGAAEFADNPEPRCP